MKFSVTRLSSHAQIETAKSNTGTDTDHQAHSVTFCRVMVVNKSQARMRILAEAVRFGKRVGAVVQATLKFRGMKLEGNLQHPLVESLVPYTQ